MSQVHPILVEFFPQPSFPSTPRNLLCFFIFSLLLSSLGKWALFSGLDVLRQPLGRGWKKWQKGIHTSGTREQMGHWLQCCLQLSRSFLCAIWRSETMSVDHISQHHRCHLSSGALCQYWPIQRNMMMEYISGVFPQRGYFSGMCGVRWCNIGFIIFLKMFPWTKSLLQMLVLSVL